MATVTGSLTPKKQRWPGRARIGILVLLLAVMTGLYYVTFRFFIPATAGFAIPQKWRRIPLRQPRSLVQGYLGTPTAEHPSANSDEWVAGAKDRAFVLKIYYVQDTVAASYSIHYRYHKWFGERDYTLDTGTIR